MKILKISLFILLGVALVYAIGPSEDYDYKASGLPVVPVELTGVEAYVKSREAEVAYMKPNNASKIIWADSIPQKTSYCLLYLPGFSGTFYEAEPLHRDLAKQKGWNLYLPRLQAHGVAPEEPFLELTAQKYVQSAREALAVASKLADSVIIMSTSTGGTLSLILASEENPQIAGLIMYSPNIEIFNPASKLLDGPWGLQIARAVYGGNYHEWKREEPHAKQYWTLKYRLEGLIQLQALLSATMHQGTFEQVDVPAFVGCYYKDASHQDFTVSVKAMKEMFGYLKTPVPLKSFHEFPEAKAHVIACKTESGAYEEVKTATFNFVARHY